MRIVIGLPDEYAEAVRRELARRGYRDGPNQVRRMLRSIALRQLAAWWRDRAIRLWRRGDLDTPTVLKIVFGVRPYDDMRKELLSAGTSEE